MAQRKSKILALVPASKPKAHARPRPIMLHVHSTKPLSKELRSMRRYCSLDNAFKVAQFLARHYASPGTVLELVHELTSKQLGWIKVHTGGRLTMWSITDEDEEVM